jgi:hypothetical protein
VGGWVGRVAGGRRVGPAAAAPCCRWLLARAYAPMRDAGGMPGSPRTLSRSSASGAASLSPPACDFAGPGSSWDSSRLGPPIVGESALFGCHIAERRVAHCIWLVGDSAGASPHTPLGARLRSHECQGLLLVP